MSLNNKSQKIDQSSLVAEAKEGNLKAMSNLIDLHKENLFQYCNFLTKNEALAEDMAQETFIKAFKNIRSLKDNKMFKSWIFTIAKRNFFSHSKLLKNKDTVDEQQILECGYTDNRLELNDLINKILTKMHPEESEALLLTHVAKNNYLEAAKIMGITQVNLDWRVRQARKKFVEYLEKNKIEVTGIFVLPKKDIA